MPFNAVECSQAVPHEAMGFVTGTWSATYSSGISFRGKTAAAETTTVHIPIELERRADAYGVRIKSVELHYRATTADLSGAPTAVLYRQNLDAVAGAGTDITASTITTTFDGVVTSAATDRLATVTVSSPNADLSTKTKASYLLSISMPCAAGTVLRVYKAVVYFDQIV